MIVNNIKTKNRFKKFWNGFGIFSGI